MTQQDIHGDRQQLTKISVGTFLVRSVYSPGEKSELILTVKIQTRHPVNGPFGHKFPGYVIIAELLRPEVARLENFENFSSYFKRSLANCRYCADRAQNLPRPASHIWLTIFQILSRSIHFRRSYCGTREDHFCPVEYIKYRLFEPTLSR